MLAFFATMIVLLLSAYYLLSVQKQKAKEEAKKKKEAAIAAQKKKEEEEERQLLLKNRKKKKPIQQQKKKQKQQQEKPHDPSSNERYIRRFGGHQRDISAIALSPSGEWMATTCVDGQLRVARVEKDSSNNMFVTTTIPDHDKAVAMSWEADNRTIACVLDRNNEIAFFRIRKKQQAAADSAFPYELIELAKRRFSTDDKYDKISACVTDQTSSLFHLVLLSGDSPSRPKAKTITAWDGMTGQFLQTLSTGSLNNGNVRVSKDAKFVAGRCHGACNEVKLFEIVKKRHKGEVEPQFDALSAKSVMTLTVGKKVQDVDFLYDAGNEHACDKAVVCCTDGTMQIWNLNVEYRQQQDPKLIHELSCEGVFLNKDIVSLATNQNNHQIAVATAGSSIHLFTFNEKKKDIAYNFSMEDCHGRKGIEDVCFGNNNNDNAVLYSKGTTSKDVFSWNVAL